VHFRVTTGDVRTTKRQRKKEDGEIDGNEFESSLDPEPSGFGFDEVSYDDAEQESKPKPKVRKTANKEK